MFKAICVFQLILGIFSLIEGVINTVVVAYSDMFAAYVSSAERLVYIVLAISGFASSILLMISWKFGLNILKNKHKRAEVGQVLCIVLIGLAFIDIIISLLMEYRVLAESVMFVVVLCSSIFYYIYLRQIIKGRFWSEIKNNSEKVFNETLGGRITEESGVFMKANSIRPEGDIEYTVIEGVLKEKKIGSESQTSAVIVSKNTDMVDDGITLLKDYYDNTYTNAIDEEENRILGTIVIPQKGDVLNKENKIGFCLSSSKLIILDDSNVSNTVMEKIQSRSKLIDSNPLRIFIAFIESLISEDIMFMSRYDVMFNLLENGMEKEVNEIPKNFSSFVGTSKKELKTFMTYYKALDFLVSELDGTEILGDECDKKLQHLAYKIQNLYSEASNLREDAQQIQDIYQSTIDVRQNKVMSLLTIVTTIFTPLTIITGWYGMNVRMPEVGWKYSYLFIILIAIGIILVEISIFKKKKWF